LQDGNVRREGNPEGVGKEVGKRVLSRIAAPGRKIIDGEGPPGGTENKRRKGLS